MTPRLHKTLKVSPEIHHRIKLLAAQRDVSMAQLISDTISQRWQYYDSKEWWLLPVIQFIVRDDTGVKEIDDLAWFAENGYKRINDYKNIHRSIEIVINGEVVFSNELFLPGQNASYSFLPWVDDEHSSSVFHIDEVSPAKENP